MLWWIKTFLNTDEDESTSNLDEGSKNEQNGVTLVIYDITDNKRRYKVFKALKGYGVPVQKSAFECRLDNTRSDKMVRRLLHIIDPNNDLLRVYKLGRKYDVQCWGKVEKIENERDYWIV
jgi:CRISPR-associated protein Cas2